MFGTWVRSVGGTLARGCAHVPGARRTACRMLARLQGRQHWGTLADGTPVWSRIDEDHLAAHPEAAGLLPRALPRIDAPPDVGAHAAHEVEFESPVGTITCVETSDQDEIVFARRKGRRAGWTRFVRNRSGEPCQTFVVRLETDPDGITEVRTAYVGRLTPPEPWHPRAAAAAAVRAHALAFWSAHALVWDGLVEEEPPVATRCPAYWGEEGA